jgi:TPR repeat protein
MSTSRACGVLTALALGISAAIVAEQVTSPRAPWVGLGAIYGDGRVVPRDAAEAVRWYHRAAAHGNVRALYALAIAYQTGWGVPQDLREAMRWYRLAAAPESAQPLLIATPQP